MAPHDGITSGLDIYIVGAYFIIKNTGLYKIVLLDIKWCC
jgi:hypothetical protein